MGFADVIKLRILEVGIILDYPDGPNVITTVLKRGRQEGQSQRRRLCDAGSSEWKEDREQAD